MGAFKLGLSKGLFDMENKMSSAYPIQNSLNFVQGYCIHLALTLSGKAVIHLSSLAMDKIG